MTWGNQTTTEYGNYYKEKQRTRETIENNELRVREKKHAMRQKIGKMGKA